MNTIKGEIPDDQLRKEVKDEPVPCGTCRTTEFFAADGEMVRRDIQILVDTKLVPGLAGLTGEK